MCVVLFVSLFPNFISQLGFWVSYDASPLVIQLFLLHLSCLHDQQSDACRIHSLSYTYFILLSPSGCWFVCVYSFHLLFCLYQSLPCGSLDVLCMIHYHYDRDINTLMICIILVWFVYFLFSNLIRYVGFYLVSLCMILCFCPFFTSDLMCYVVTPVPHIFTSMIRSFS